MSPSESQLRAALRRGEGESPDSDAVIARARAGRRTRRATLGAVAGTVAAVLAVGLGVGLTQTGSSGQHRPAAQQGTAGGATPSGAATSGGAYYYVCPGKAPQLPTPTPGSNGTGPLLPAGTSKITVCAYQQDGTYAGGYTLTGSDAAALTQRLNQAPATWYGAATCPPTSAAKVVLAPDGAPAAVGRLTACGELTNGATTRYDRSLLVQLAGRATLHPIQTGRMTHGPAPSK